MLNIDFYEVLYINVNFITAVLSHMHHFLMSQHKEWGKKFYISGISSPSATFMCYVHIYWNIDKIYTDFLGNKELPFQDFITENDHKKEIPADGY